MKRCYVVPPAKPEFHEFMLIHENGEVVASHVAPHGLEQAYLYFITANLPIKNGHIVKLGFDSMTREELLRRNKIRNPEETP